MEGIPNTFCLLVSQNILAKGEHDFGCMLSAVNVLSKSEGNKKGSLIKFLDYVIALYTL